MRCRLGTKDDIDAIVHLVSDAIKEMELHGIYQWDEIYPTAGDFAEDIKKQLICCRRKERADRCLCYKR